MSPERSSVPRLPLGRWTLRSVAVSYLFLMLLVPLLVLAQDGLRGGLAGLWASIRHPVAWHALRLTLWTAAVTVAINGVMGLLTAYVLVRYEFRGKSILNAMVDLPLAIPTLVTGVMLVVLYGPQRFLGSFIAQTTGQQIIFAPPAIILALLFVTFPLVVRSTQPVLMSLDRSPEDAAATLGASPWHIFWRVTLPALTVPTLSGCLLSFARAIGEFGAVVIVAGNIPLYSQTAAVYVLGEVESENRMAASSMSLVMLAVALSLVFIVDRLQKRGERRRG